MEIQDTELSKIKQIVKSNIGVIASELEIDKEQIILMGFRGSISHGLWMQDNTDTANSDVDLMIVFCGTIDSYLRITKKIRESQQIKLNIDKYEFDIVAYDIRKMFSLLMNSNPNVMDFLFMERDMYVFMDWEGIGSSFIESRNMFLSRKISETYGAYGSDQLHKMIQSQYALYMGEKRKLAVDKFGYDTKNASHCIRLLTMAVEAMKSGTLKVKRNEDKDLYMNIRSGKYSFEEIKEMANSLRKELEELSKTEGILPKHIDINMVEYYLVRYIERFSSYLQFKVPTI